MLVTLLSPSVLMGLVFDINHIFFTRAQSPGAIVDLKH